MNGGPPTRSTIRCGQSVLVPTRRGFPTMMIMMMLPMIVGALATLVASWTGFIEAAFMDMTLTLEGFDYKFGPAECNGAWGECGNATFESYQRARDLALVLFILALVVVAVKDMLKGGLGGDVNLGVVDTKTLPEMLKYSVLVFAFLFIFPPVWDTAAGLMNNVGIWILNPMYDLAGRGEYVHGDKSRDNPLPMCVGGLAHDDLVEMAPYVRDWDAWAIYKGGDTGPMNNGVPSLYREADNYIIDRNEVLPRECLQDVNLCPAHVSRPSPPVGYQIEDVLCNPDFRVKYVFRQALGVVEMESVSPEQVLGAVSGTGGDDILVAILTQFLKSSVTLQVIMVVFMTGVMVDVVTSFALAILPIVPFYRFLPMSDKVRLGDYSGAAFALLAMPLVASLVLVAGSGAVANMAVDDQEFGSFFTWLAALSVVLLVIGIPATMIPLIGAAQQQATAAIQTGVQTASFAATATAASAGGAIQGRRASMEYRRLNRMNPSVLSPTQRTRLKELTAQGYGRMSTARAAFQGGTQGMRSQMYDEKGQPAKAFRQAVMPETGELTGKSIKGLGAFEGGDATKGMPDLPGIVGTTAADATRAAKRQKGREPTKKEMLEAAGKQNATAKEDLKDANDRVKEAREDAEKVDGYGRVAGMLMREQHMVDGERQNLVGAESGLKKTQAKLEAAEAKTTDLIEKQRVLEAEMEGADAARRAEIEKEIAKTRRMITNTANTMSGMRETITGFEEEITRSTESLDKHTKAVGKELDRLAGEVAGGTIGGPVGDAITEQHTALKEQRQATTLQEEATRNLQEIVKDSHRHPEEYGRHYEWRRLDSPEKKPIG